MKKLMTIVLLAVFTLATFGTVIATKSSAAVIYPICNATCDMGTGLWYVCCIDKKSPKSKKTYEYCYYGDQCYFPPQ